MEHKNPDNSLIYMVVENTAEQYSIWPVVPPLFVWWETVPKTGSLDECLAYVSALRTSAQPLSLHTSTPYPA